MKKFTIVDWWFTIITFEDYLDLFFDDFLSPALALDDVHAGGEGIYVDR